MNKSTKIIIALVVGAFSLGGVYFSNNFQVIPKTSRGISSCVIEEDNIVRLINEVRNMENILPVAIDCSLSNLVKARAIFLFDNHQWSHEGFSEAIQNLEARFSKRGEILARNYSDKEAIEAWIKSDKHRPLLLNKDFKYIGVGKSGNIIVVWFIN